MQKNRTDQPNVGNQFHRDHIGLVGPDLAVPDHPVAPELEAGESKIGKLHVWLVFLSGAGVAAYKAQPPPQSKAECVPIYGAMHPHLHTSWSPRTSRRETRRAAPP